MELAIIVLLGVFLTAFFGFALRFAAHSRAVLNGKEQAPVAFGMTREDWGVEVSEIRAGQAVQPQVKPVGAGTQVQGQPNSVPAAV